MVPGGIGAERPAEQPADVTRTGVVTLAMGVVALAGCGGGSAQVATHPPTTTAPTVPANGGGPSVTVGIICITPTDAAQAVVSAWQAGDAAAAARCATAGTVSTLFAHPGAGAGWTFQGCDGPDPGVPICTFDYPGGHASLTLQGTEAQGWKVAQVAFAP